MYDDLKTIAVLFVIFAYPAAHVLFSDHRKRRGAAARQARELRRECKAAARLARKHAPAGLAIIGDGPPDEPAELSETRATGPLPESAEQRRTAARPAKPPRISPETIEALHKQADAERRIAEALERKAQYTPDPVQSARIEKQAAAAWVRFNQILDRIDKYTI